MSLRGSRPYTARSTWPCAKNRAATPERMITTKLMAGAYGATFAIVDLDQDEPNRAAIALAKTGSADSGNGETLLTLISQST
jgi:hypothetical protein